MRFALAIALSTLAIAEAGSAVNFNDGQVHNIDVPVGDLKIDLNTPATGTVVNLLAGSTATNVTAYEDSVLTVDGVVVSSGSSALCGCVAGEGRADIMFTSGTINGGSGDLVATAQSSAVLFGGLLRDARATDDATLVVHGGDLESVTARQNAMVDLRGVSSFRGQSRLIADETALLIIHGTNFLVDGTPVPGEMVLTSLGGGDYFLEPERRLSGTLSDGTSLDQPFFVGGLGSIVLVPESTSGSLILTSLVVAVVLSRIPS